MSEGNGYATKEAFLSGFKRRFREVEIPGLGKVKIGNQSERERQRFERKWLNTKGDVVQAKADRIRLYYVLDCVWLPDESARMFSDDDMQSLIDADLDGAVTRRLMKEIREHCDLDVEELEDAAKN